MTKPSVRRSALIVAKKIERQSVDPSLREDLLERAQTLRINLSQAGEQALRYATQEETRRWTEQNAELVESYAATVEQEGLPLAKYRTF
ncbi:MAG TPA: type II toxin-antitoxin system CcdA family antitoxin [Pararobbsia sp.]|nr:type II toxin-antitoxin system CcdA family antitoxin [Pararobbsia sp.]